MFNRSILKNLQIWAQNEDRKPLVLRGARQVGKTTTVKIFSQQFDQYIYLNLEKTEDVSFFNSGLSIHELLAAIFFAKNLSRNKGRTLLFIDEIQNSAKAISRLRYFYEEAKDIYVIAAGSLLETLINKQISFPVGRVEYLFMKPLSFEEFLLALGENTAVELLNTIPLPVYAHEKLLKLFHQYTLIGGMPEIVDKYLKNQDIVLLNDTYKNLLITYIDDVEKYAKNQNATKIIRHVINSAPYESGKRIKFHGFGHSTYSSKEISEALRILEKAMLVTLIYPTTSTQPPLEPDYKKSPRLQFLDTGLVNYFAGLQSYYFTMQDLSSIYQGFLAEHIVGQELDFLFSQSIRKLNFWVREKNQANAEVDFIIPYKKYLVPIEIKSGKSGTLKSLHQFIERTNHPYAVRLYAGKLEKITAVTPNGNPYTLINLPYFLTTKLLYYLEYFVN